MDGKVSALTHRVRSSKGRGYFRSHDFDSLDSSDIGPQRSIKGWIILVTGIHEEAKEEHLYNVFQEFGQVNNLHLNLDRFTGFVKGYALVEYERYEEAANAIRAMDGTQELFNQTIHIDWAFGKGPASSGSTGSKYHNLRSRSRTPPRRLY
ncbi:RNA-binding 8A [Rhynchospora pubera]|uniref:RNA-binding protein 8A n=1 Tax=Rhynchospora pubera TaxID=906938 RepID=A0AAV8DQ99_9POAL|nr:RNA-binding 8A [Rhynchospora pubera]